MKPTELAPGIFHLRGGSNMGLVVHKGKGLLIDTGLDKDAARRALRIIESLETTLEAVFLTHAHADHFGGAHFLQRRLEIPLYAPSLEAAMMENPIIEPLYLYGGAAPIGELRHKFTWAKACQIDNVVEGAKTTPMPLQISDFQVEIVSLPGHAPNQMGVAVNNVDRKARSTTLCYLCPGPRSGLCRRRRNHQNMRGQPRAAGNCAR
jgi:glyoxylase-like metal-dependent hydrolase (beta-lactamase superfamily II)